MLVLPMAARPLLSMSPDVLLQFHNRDGVQHSVLRLSLTLVHKLAHERTPSCAPTNLRLQAQRDGHSSTSSGSSVPSLSSLRTPQDNATSSTGRGSWNTSSGSTIFSRNGDAHACFGLDRPDALEELEMGPLLGKGAWRAPGRKDAQLWAHAGCAHATPLGQPWHPAWWLRLCAKGWCRTGAVVVGAGHHTPCAAGQHALHPPPLGLSCQNEAPESLTKVPCRSGDGSCSAVRLCRVVRAGVPWPVAGSKSGRQGAGPLDGADVR